MGWERPSAGSGTRAARLAGAGLVTVISSVGALYLLLPLATRAFVRVLMLTVNACVWVAAALSSGADPWSILLTIGRVAGEALATREASGILLGLSVIGALAFYWFQRLVGSDEESSR